MSFMANSNESPNSKTLTESDQNLRDNNVGGYPRDRPSAWDAPVVNNRSFRYFVSTIRCDESRHHKVKK
jgi:hypothetical protein